MEQPSQNHSQASYSVTCLVEARKEYEARILRDLSHAIYTSLKQLYVDAQNYVNDSNAEENGEDKAGEVQAAFQQLLAEIPKWNADVISDETEAILRSHPHTPKLFKKIIHANAQILASMSNGKRFQISVPPFENFVHTVFKATAELFQDTYSFVDEYGRIDRRNHVADIKQCISDALKQVTPIQDFLGDDAHAPKQETGDLQPEAPTENGSEHMHMNEDESMEQKIQQMQDRRNTMDENEEDEEDAGGQGHGHPLVQQRSGQLQDDTSSLKHVRVTRDALHDNPERLSTTGRDSAFDTGNDYEEEDDDF